MQRYLDAAKCFNFILTYISKCVGAALSVLVGEPCGPLRDWRLLPRQASTDTNSPAACCRAKHQARGAVYEQILKKNEQMYALLAIVTALCPTANRLLDEAVTNTLRDK